MNLHILPDSKFTEAFYLNMKEAGLLQNNTFVIRTNQKTLKYVKQQIPFGPLYSPEFANHTGDTSNYANVYIHQLAPLMYRWIAKNSFRELHWMSWGTDLYNLPFVKTDFYEPETRTFIKRSRFDLNKFLYIVKVYLTNMPFKNEAYSKVKSMLTWMSSEFQFATANIAALKAYHKYFFYENQMPYEHIDKIIGGSRTKDVSGKLKLIVGNSGTASNNHIDAIRSLQEMGVEADLYIPVSYGESDYISFLKANTNFYKRGRIFFMDEFMDFEKYVHFLYSSDAIIMNHIRPQGYGNIFMMMYMNKPVMFNPKNISLPDLKAAGIQWLTIDALPTLKAGVRVPMNRENIINLLSHDRLQNLYRNLFSG
jgi:dTDP-N-acetylfucosamine:lipid II N-acetylfucosaminyltransferase